MIDQVVGASRADFEDNGVSMDVLQELRASWQKNLTALKGARYPWEQQQQQPAGDEKDFEVKPEPLSPGPVEREVDPSESVYCGALTPDNPQLAAARAARQVQRQFSQQGAGKYYPAVHESVAGLMSLASGIPTGSPPMGSAALQLPGGSSATTNGGHMGQNDGADDASRIKHEDAGRRKEMHSIPQLDGALEDADEDAINSDLDDPDELGSDADGEGDDEGGSIMLCLYDKVQRTKNKWKCVMKDGILNINGKEYVFSRATGEYEW